MRGHAPDVSHADWQDPRPDVATLPGRDHRSLLLFLQTVEANNGGDVAHAASRGCEPGYPNRMRNKRLAVAASDPSFAWKPTDGTRYDDGTQKADHDDWDALEDLEDLEAWGFIRCGGTGLQPVVALTDKGHAYAAVLIRERGERTRGTYTKDGT